MAAVVCLPCRAQRAALAADAERVPDAAPQIRMLRRRDAAVAHAEPPVLKPVAAVPAAARTRPRVGAVPLMRRPRRHAGEEIPPQEPRPASAVADRTPRRQWATRFTSSALTGSCS
jgi:hypothetical protein